MSEVYLARAQANDAPRRPLVIKRLLPNLAEDAKACQTFLYEAQMHARVHHPNVVDVYESGLVDGEPFLALEYVHGVDLFRLLRRARDEQKPLRPELCVHVARRLCEALACVHEACDEQGLRINLVHRDVTPSNVYLSDRGVVKLGDFGIASIARSGQPATSAALKGKFGYLAPEQVDVEPFDHRADLFSLAIVLSEMLLGQPLFQGSQLAVLLAIREVRIDLLRNAAAGLPEGLFEVLERALARKPDDRYPTAAELGDALEPFESDSATRLRDELSGWVGWGRDASSIARHLEGMILETRRSGGHRLRTSGAAPLVDEAMESGVSPIIREAEPAPDSLPPSSGDAPLVLEVRRSNRAPRKDVAFTKLIEMIATGQVGPDDEVDLGGGFLPVGRISMLSRYLPVRTGTTTKKVQGPGVPDYAEELESKDMLDVMAWVLKSEQDGVLFAERDHHDTHVRKEMYFAGGQMMLAMSNEPSELLGEHLVRKGIIDRPELEMALIAMHNHENPLGDTLIALGLVDPLDMFQAIRTQGLERVIDVFKWKYGRISFFKDVEAPRKDFPLHLEIPMIMLEGAELRADAIKAYWGNHMSERFAASSEPLSFRREPVWPEYLDALVRCLGHGRTLLETVERLTNVEDMSIVDTLCALEVGLAIGIVERAD